VNFPDVIEFLIAFGSGNLRADLAPSGVLDFDDVMAFLVAFDRYYTD